MGAHASHRDLLIWRCNGINGACSWQHVWGAETQPPRLTWVWWLEHDEVSGILLTVLWSSLYLILGRVFQFLVLLGHGDRAKAAEVVVLRHQVAVLRRQVNRPDLQPGDRVVLAALSRLLPRSSWDVFFVTPATLLRWHRALATRRWTLRLPIIPSVQVTALPGRLRFLKRSQCGRMTGRAPSPGLSRCHEHLRGAAVAPNGGSGQGCRDSRPASPDRRPRTATRRRRPGEVRARGSSFSRRPPGAAAPRCPASPSASRPAEYRRAVAPRSGEAASCSCVRAETARTPAHGPFHRVLVLRLVWENPS